MKESIKELFESGDFIKVNEEYRNLSNEIRYARSVVCNHNKNVKGYVLDPYLPRRIAFHKEAKKHNAIFKNGFLVKKDIPLVKRKKTGIAQITRERYGLVFRAYDKLSNSGKTNKEKYEALSTRKMKGKIYSPQTIRDIIEKKKYLL